MWARRALKAQRKAALVLVASQPKAPDQPADQSPDQASPPQASQPHQASPLHQVVQQRPYPLPHLVTARDADRPPLSIATPTAEPIAAEAIVAEAVAVEAVAIAPAAIEPAAIDPFPDAPAGDERISWGALGCPRETGAYIAIGFASDDSNVKINVKRIHILAAESDPAALFTVVTLRPPLGPPLITLGHRVA